MACIYVVQQFVKIMSPKKKSLKFAACLPVNEFMLINYSTRNQNGILHRQDEVRLYSRFRLPRYILGDRLPDK
jgi:hypothetical protein